MPSASIDHDALLFLGRRGPAVKASRALGLAPLVVTDGPAERVADGRRRHPFADTEGLAGLVEGLAGARRVRAVIAATEGSVVPAARLRERLGLPGLSVESALRCTDKVRMKRAARAAGLVTADFVAADEGLGGEALIERLGLPLVVKARAASGSRGTRVVRHAADVPGELPPDAMAESFVGGVEMSFESLLAAGATLFENPTEYFRPGWANIVPAALEDDVLRRVVEVNRTAARALGVEQGITHLEVFLQPDGGVVFGELAARPPGGHLMELIRRAYRFDPWEALLRILLGERPELPSAAERTAGVWLLHPGPGVVARLDGVEPARSLPGVVDLPVRVAPGESVVERVGVGQEIGHITVEGASRDEVAERLVAAHETIRVEVRAE